MNAFKPVNYRVFKLSDGEEVNAGAIEKLIEDTCHYVKYAVVGENDANKVVAFIFPNDKLLNHPDYRLTANEGCFCPRSLNELGKCLSGCMKLANEKIALQGDRVKEAILFNSDENSEEGPKISYLEVIKKYRALLKSTFGNHVPPLEEIYYMKNL